MMISAIVNLGVVGVALFVLLFYLIRFVFRYKHEYESNPLCTLTVVFCLLVVFITTFMLPVDIFLVSFVKEPNGDLKDWAKPEVLELINKGVFGTYYALYGICIVSIFIIIPFLHFFNEESESNSNDRLHNAIKYTFGCLLVLTTLIALGCSLPLPGPDMADIMSKIAHLTETTKFQRCLHLVLGILSMAGIMNVAFYTASGLSTWPIGLLIGTTSVSQSLSNLNDREVLIRIRINNLREKARASRLSDSEQEQLREAENELAELEREGVVLSGYTDSWTYKLRKAIRPLQIVAGTLFGTLSMFLLVTLIIVNVDRIFHGAGAKQGYILLKPQTYNPLEYLYEKIESMILIGSMPLLLTTSYLVIATISGMRNLGLWFLVARVYNIKVGRTTPQALLFFCVSLMLAALSLNFFLFSITTQYVTYGNQYTRQANGTATPCTLESYSNDSNCIPTRSSILIMSIISEYWYLGAAMYWWNWIFVVVSIVSLLACIIKGRRRATHGIVSDLDDFEE